jgi:fumarate reductase flavoprotein subunit
MGEEIGADIVGYDTGLLNPASGNAKNIESELPPWLILVNLEGRRFMDETAPYSVSGYIMNHQTHKRTFAIFDEPTLVKASNDTRYSDPYNCGVPLSSWDENTIRACVASGKIKTAKSLAELAAFFAIDAIALQVTIDRYNADCDKGIDGEYFKKMEERFSIRKPPFYISEVRASTIGLTGAGLNINEEAQVLDEHQRPISGLYAAGEVTGCIQGRRYGGGGMGIANSVIYGRVAGAAAAAAARLGV